MLNLTTVADQIPPKVPNSADTPTKLKAPAGLNLKTVADQIPPKVPNSADTQN